jgi:hypothetical protein
MPWVKIKPGRTHGVGDRYHAGDVFEATAEEARDFGDKFLVVPAPAEVEAQAEPVMDVTAAPVDTAVTDPTPAPKKRGRRSMSEV